jgi:hypothetical protein
LKSAAPHCRLSPPFENNPEQHRAQQLKNFQTAPGMGLDHFSSGKPQPFTRAAGRQRSGQQYQRDRDAAGLSFA